MSPRTINYRAFEICGFKPYALIALVFIAAIISKPSLAQNNIRLGLAAPISGPLSNAGKAMAAGFSRGVKDAAARHNLSITLVIENDEGSTAGAKLAARALVEKGVRIVIGHYTSAPTLTGNALYARNNTLLVAPSAGSPKLMEPKSANVLRLAPREDSQGLFAGQYLIREFPEGQIAILNDGTVTSAIMAKAAKSAWTGALRKPVIEAEWIATPGDIAANAAQLAQTLTRKNAAAIYWTGAVSAAGPLLKSMQASGATIPVMGTDALATPEFPAAAGDATEGVRMTILAGATPSPTAQDIAAWLKTEGVRDIPLALATYASVQIVTEAAVRLGSFEPDMLGAALRGGALIETIVGPVSFDAQGERREQLYTIAVWKKAADGKFIFAPQ